MKNSNATTQGRFAKALFDVRFSMPPEVVGFDGKASYKRFSVYRNNVAHSLIEAMAANFPTVAHLLGEAAFPSIASEYIRAHPPKTPVLIHLGSDFAQFIEGFAAAQNMPYLADVARVEFAWLQSYHATDFPVLDAPTLGEIAPALLPSIMLTLHSGAWLLDSKWAAASLVACVHSNSDIEKIEVTSSEAILITRPVLDVELRVLSKQSFEFHTSIVKGYSLEQASNRAYQNATPMDHEFDLTSEISRMLQYGAFGRSILQ